MKAKFLAALILSLLIPLSASADIASDMKNPQLSLTAVMQNALAEGMSVADAVTEMLAIEPGQSSAIIATAMVIAPGAYEAIINAAINAGVAADKVVAAALIATDGQNADKIIDAVVAAAPGSRDAIVAASAQVLLQTAVAVATPTAAKSATEQSSGGGAPSTTSTSAAALVAAQEAAVAAAEADSLHIEGSPTPSRLARARRSAGGMHPMLRGTAPEALEPRPASLGAPGRRIR